jgi:ribonuclease HI
MEESESEMPVLPYTLYFDGSCLPNNPGGVVGAGWYLEGGAREGVIAFSGGPAATNNVAEYIALIRGLQHVAREFYGKFLHLIVRGDSKLVIEQMKGNWKVNATNMKPLHSIARLLVKDMRDQGQEVEFEWVPREANETADDLSKQTLKEVLKDGTNR